MTIGERIRAFREAKRWKQKDLAEETGIFAACISLYESGRTIPSTFNLIAIADALEVSLDDLVGRKVKKSYEN